MTKSFRRDLEGLPCYKSFIILVVETAIRACSMRATHLLPTFAVAAAEGAASLVSL